MAALPALAAAPLQVGLICINLSRSSLAIEGEQKTVPGPLANLDVAAGLPPVFTSHGLVLLDKATPVFVLAGICMHRFQYLESGHTT